MKKAREDQENEKNRLAQERKRIEDEAAKLSPISECAVVTTLMGDNLKTQGDTEGSVKLQKFASAWAYTLFDSAEKKGIPEQIVIQKNKDMTAYYLDILKSYTASKKPLDQYIKLMTGKMDGCVKILKEDEALRKIFQSKMK